MVFITEDSDSDTISLTSTVESEHDSDTGFNVERILAQERVNGVTQYLVRWEGYPLHRCTWEPQDQFVSDVPIDAWKQCKAEAARGGKPLFDIDEYHRAFELAQDEHEERQKRRDAKRRRINGTASRLQPPRSASTRKASTARVNATGSTIKKKGIAQKVGRSTASSAQKPVKPVKPKPVTPVAAAGKTSVTAQPASTAAPPATTTVPPAAKMQAPLTAAKKPAWPARKTAPSAPPKISMEAPAKRQRKTAAPNENGFKSLSERGRFQRLDRAERAPDTNALPLFDPKTGMLVGGPKQSENVTDRPVATAAPAVPAVPVAPMATMNAERRPSQPAAAKDVPTPSTANASTNAIPTRPALSRISTTHAQASNTATSPVSAQVPTGPPRSANPFAAAAVAPAQPTARAPPRAPARKASDIPSAYGRRTPPREPRRRIPSPDLPAPIPQSDQPLTYTRHQTCRYWLSGYCERTQAECPFAHYHVNTGNKPTGGRRYTCRAWQMGNNCPKSAGRCENAHWDTEALQPVSGKLTCFFWARPGGSVCRKSDDQCNYAHWDTGMVAPPPRGIQDRVPKPATEPPDTGFTSATNNANFDFRAPPPPPPPLRPPTVPQQNIQGPVSQAPPAPVLAPATTSVGTSTLDRSTASAQHPTADPRLMGRSKPVGQAQASTAMDLDAGPQNLETPASPVQDDEDVDVEMDDSVSVASELWVPRVDEDLELAKQSIGTLDMACLTDRDGGHIEDVFISMPPERHGEEKLLTELFEGSFKCKVWHSNIANHWKFFRSLTKGFSLIVIGTHETFLGTLPGYSTYQNPHRNHMYAIGVHEDWKDGSTQTEPQRGYGARLVFPSYGGTVTFISDDVLVYYPEKATKIIEQLIEKAKKKPAGCEASKIATRPGAAQWLIQLAEQKKKEHGDKNPWADLSVTVLNLCPLEDYDQWQMSQGTLVPKEEALLISRDAQSLPSFQGMWEKDEAAATDFMADLFAGDSLHSKRWYQKFMFVFQRPDAMREDERMTSSQLSPQAMQDQIDPRGWMKKYNHIEVVTPEMCLKRGLRKQ